MKKSKRTDRLISLKNRLAEVLANLHGVSNECTEKEFLQLFAMLGANKTSVLALISMMRYFYPESRKSTKSMKFMAPKDPYTQISRMGRGWKRWSDFLYTIDNFVPGQKGAKGGLMRHKSQIEEEKKDRVSILKDYLNLRYKQKLSEKEENAFNYYEMKIPEEIKSQLKPRFRAITELAVKWMVQEFGCSESTLQQILYRKK